MPKSENIKLIIERNNLKNAIYVGDTELDMEAAFAAGIPFVFAEYGFGNANNAKNKISCFSYMLKLDYDNL